MNYNFLLLSVFCVAYSQEEKPRIYENKWGVRVVISGSGNDNDIVRACSNLTPTQVGFLNAQFLPEDEDKQSDVPLTLKIN